MNVVLDDSLAIVLWLVMQFMVMILVDFVLLVLDLDLVKESFAGLEICQAVLGAMADQKGHIGTDILVTSREQQFTVGQHVKESLGRAPSVDQGILVVLGDLLGVTGDELGGEVDGDLERGQDLGDGSTQGNGQSVGTRGSGGEDERRRHDHA